MVRSRGVLGVCQTSVMGLLRKNSKQQKAVKYFCKKLSSIDFWEGPKFASDKSYSISIIKAVLISTNLYFLRNQTEVSVGS